MFINLNVHSYYSLLMSSISIDDIINFAVKNNQKYVSLIDINTMYGTVEFYHKAIKNNLIPIIGLQVEYKNEKVVLIAKNNNGYKKLIKISSLIMTQQELVLEDHINDLFVIVEDINNSSWLTPNENCFSFNQQKQRPIAIRESFYENKEDVEYVKVLKAISNGLTFDQIKDDDSFNDKWMFSNQEAEQTFNKESLNNLDKLITSCQWTLDFYKERHLVKFDKNHNSKVLLESMCAEGLKKRLNSNEAPVKYIERLTKELQIIDQMGFNDYFLVVQDYVGFAKSNGILVGPGRGSAAGSLVAYTLGITEIDPIQNDLIFERFLNPERQTMPDIDIDFMDDRRNEVIEYIYNKYSSNNVAHILTFQRMKSKMALRDVCRVFEFDLKLVSLITKEFTMDFDLDIDGAITKNKKIAEYSNKYPQLFKIAKKLLNFPRQIGQHAAGVIISDKPLDEIIPIQLSTDNIYSTQYSMEYLESFGLIKMDILGLVNLSTINQCLNLIEKTKGIKINLEKIPLDDQKVFYELSIGNTSGIFQLESPGMRNLIIKIKPKNIEDISITSALFRPGPQKNIPTYLKNKAEPDKIKYLNDDFKKALSSTYNIIIYQEQVIDIVCRVAKFSLAEADLFRRAISKKDSHKLHDLREQFIAGGLKNNYTKEKLEQIFDYIYEFANYGFNHSHSLAYSYVSYWMAYLKIHYPIQYFTTLLSSNDNSADKISTYVNEARKNGIEVCQPSIQYSHFNFSIKKSKIVFGFNAIKGIGRETIHKILTIRKSQENYEFKNLFDAIGKLANNSIGQKTIEILVKAGCFDCFLEKDQTRMYILENLTELFKASRLMKPNGEFIISPNIKDVKTTPEQLIELEDDQFSLLGVSFSEHPIIKIKNEFNGNETIVSLADAFINESGYSYCIVFLNSFREITTKTGLPMAFVKLEDESKVSDAVIFPNVYTKCKPIIKKGEVYLANLKLSPRGLQLLSIKPINHE